MPMQAKELLVVHCGVQHCESKPCSANHAMQEVACCGSCSKSHQACDGKGLASGTKGQDGPRSIRGWRPLRPEKCSHYERAGSGHLRPDANSSRKEAHTHVAQALGEWLDLRSVLWRSAPTESAPRAERGAFFRCGPSRSNGALAERPRPLLRGAQSCGLPWGVAATPMNASAPMAKI